MPQPNTAAGRPGEPQRARVQSAARAVDILVAVAQSDTGLTTREISERVGIGRPATYHLLHTLVGAGLLARDDRNHCVLGLRVATLAEGFGRQMDPSEQLGPSVRAVAQETGETAYASAWRAREIAVVAVAAGTNPIQAATVRRGHVGDAHARASGKLLLAHATPATRDAYLESHALTCLTPNTLTTRAELEREFALIRERGYAQDDEEFALGICCLAVPFDDGYSPFVLALSAPCERLVEQRERYLCTLWEAVATVTPHLTT